MKHFLATLGAMLALFACLHASAQNQPDVVFTDEVETVVTVRGVHYVNRTVTVEDPNGERRARQRKPNRGRASIHLGRIAARLSPQ